MPQVRVRNGPQKGKIVFVQEKPIVIGREPTCPLQITDKGVSREHAKIFRVGEMVFVKDMGSRNGSFVNDERVEEDLLREGDVLRVGATQIVFESRKAALREGRDVTFDEADAYKTSLELNIKDLYVTESHSLHQHFQTLCKATEVVQAERDEKKLFPRLLELILETIPADHAFLFARDDLTNNIVPKAARRSAESIRVPISRSILRKVVHESKAVITADAMQDERFKSGDSIMNNQIRSVLCVPIVGHSTTLGAIYAVNTDLADTFEQADLELVLAVGAQLALALENLRESRAQRKMLLGALARLVSMGEGIPPQQRGHAERISDFAAAIARELDLPDREVLIVMLAGLLHDIGRSVPAGHLTSPPQGSPIAHVLAGLEFFKDSVELQDVLPGIRSSHEFYDGSGGPEGLKGEEIPLAARIISVANAFDKQLYKPGQKEDPDVLAVREVFSNLEKQAGVLFDPIVVRALIVSFRHGLLEGFGHSDSNTAMIAAKRGVNALEASQITSDYSGLTEPREERPTGASPDSSRAELVTGEDARHSS